MTNAFIVIVTGVLLRHCDSKHGMFVVVFCRHSYFLPSVITTHFVYIFVAKSQNNNINILELKFSANKHRRDFS